MGIRTGNKKLELLSYVFIYIILVDSKTEK